MSRENLYRLRNDILSYEQKHGIRDNDSRRIFNTLVHKRKKAIATRRRNTAREELSRRVCAVKKELRHESGGRCIQQCMKGLDAIPQTNNFQKAQWGFKKILEIRKKRFHYVII